ncbi:MAG: threonylcarbamoyl-AMP synthase [Fretibacterium sp.]|nr:threonylcarbamoyl-AMP synthase [Fretibacterium sp.]
MKTQCLVVNPWNPEGPVLEEATGILRRGGLVAFPTETVYGLGANGLDASAVTAIYRAKGRPSDNPLILHVSSPLEAEPLAFLDARSRALMSAFWPGPLTLVLPSRPIVPFETRGGLDSVALRMPDHPVALALIDRVGVPLAAPSANLSGRPSPTDASAVLFDLGGRIDLVLDAGPVSVGVESTVIGLCDETPLLLRAGGTAKEDIEDFLGVPLQIPNEESSRRSPGTRYRHYAPFVPVLVWKPPEPCTCPAPQIWGYLGLTPPPLPFARVVLFESLGNYARGLFAGFRLMEKEGLEGVVVQWPSGEGIGLALRDRIRRAAAVGS